MNSMNELSAVCSLRRTPSFPGLLAVTAEFTCSDQKIIKAKNQI